MNAIDTFRRAMRRHERRARASGDGTVERMIRKARASILDAPRQIGTGNRYMPSCAATWITWTNDIEPGANETSTGGYLLERAADTVACYLKAVAP